MAVKTVSEVLTELVVAAVEQAGFSELGAVETVSPSGNPSFGDYQSNHAFQINRALRAAPRAVAEKIRAAMPAHAAVEKTEVAGAGFINFHLSPGWLAGYLAELVSDENIGIEQTGAGRTVVIDYSSPNVAKRMHIGHMRSTIIGNTLHRLHEAAGWKVVADNHIGDWGTPMGKMIVAWRHWLDEDSLAADAIGELERLYVAFGDAVKVPRGEQPTAEQQALMDAARAETAKLQAGDADNRALWDRFMEISRIERDGIYERLGVKFDVTLGESFYNDVLGDVVAGVRDTGVAEDSQGAVVIRFGDDTGVKGLKSTALVIQKADGAALYSTTDFATLDHRVNTWDPDRVIYVTDGRQQLHFKQVFYGWNQWRKAREHADITRPDLVHTWFGTLKIDGEILSSREGNVIRLSDLLDESYARARAVVDEGSGHLSEEERDNIARVVGVASIRYFDLSQNPTSDVNFSWDKALAMTGNTAPYMLYAVARIRSIQRKAGVSEPVVTGIVAESPEEAAIVRQLLQFSAVVNKALESQRPNLLCDYLFETAGLLNKFYASCSVLYADTEAQKASRLALIESVARVLSRGLSILGITPLDRM
jgi:arginyl-tRNA synthetase